MNAELSYFSLPVTRAQSGSVSSLPVAVVVEFIVGREGEEGAEAGAEAEEDLRGRVNPNLET